MLDREFPRSIRFCLQQAETSLHQITGAPVGTWRNSVERTFGQFALRELDCLTIEEVTQSGLHEFLDHLQLQIIEASNKIKETFFTPETYPAIVGMTIVLTNDDGIDAPGLQALAKAVSGEG